MASHSYQRSFLPLQIVNLYPNPLNSADCKLIGKGINGKDYALKTTTDGRGFVPASELFCYELAAKVHIPTPEYRVVMMPNSELAFGSVWEGGANPLLNKIMELLAGTYAIPDFIDSNSKIFAFDLFVNNLDRHFGNYIIRDSFQREILLAYDFSRAWYEVGYEGLECLDPQHNTMSRHYYINSSQYYDSAIALETLTLIGGILSSEIHQILFSCMPDEWLPVQIKTEIVAWWGSPALADRIQILSSEV